MSDKIRDIVKFEDDFLGHGAIGAQDAGYWLATTSAGGGVTRGGINGEASVALSSASESQNVCLDFGDDLNFDIDALKRVVLRVKMGQAALTAGSEVAFGVASGRADSIDAITEQALFRVIGSDDTTAVVCESDDGSNDNNDIASGQSLVDSYKDFVIDFSGGKSNVKFYMDNGSGNMQRVASSTTFDMSNYSGGLQPYVQIQKASGTADDSVIVDYIVIESAR